MKHSVRMITSFVLIAVMILTTTMYQSAFAASKLGKVKGVKATVNVKKKTIKLSWKKVKGATGYVIYKNTKKNFKKVKAVNVKKTKKTFKKLKVGKTYYFKIAAYKKTKSGKQLGKAVVKKVKLKKATATTTAPTTTANPTTLPPRPTASALDTLLGMNKKRIDSLVKSPITGKNYALKFIDDFEGTSLNSDNWTIATHNYNAAEEQVNLAENVVVENGMLNIYARKENTLHTNKVEEWETSKSSYFTGGAIHSNGKQKFQYGRLEIYCRIPYSYGMWPAFWTMGTKKGWPWGGEIDIMEFVGGTDQWGNYRDDEYVCGLHWCDPEINDNSAYNENHLTAGFSSDTFKWTDGKKSGFKLHDEWHVCGLEWNETTMYTYMDDQVIGSIDITQSSMREAFHQAHFIILNFAMGGSWAGHPDEASGSVFPQVFQVDWIKVWQK